MITLPLNVRFEFQYKPGLSYIGSLVRTVDNETLGKAVLGSFPNLREVVSGATDNSFVFIDLDVNYRVRGNRFGSYLVDRLIGHAQSEGISILNHVVAGAGLSQEQLEDFYLRHGFERLPNKLSTAYLFFIPKQTGGKK